jgi:hypothetical protein
MPADLLTADLGADQFNAALVGQITHYLTADQNKNLFRRIHPALTRNGTLVIDCPMSTDPPSESASFLTLFMWANSGGTAHSFETYRGWLEQVGFRKIHQMSERWLSARKA